jgi:hypothetical protein
MFLRARVRKKDGKEHRYFPVVENRRVGQNQTAQRTVLYLGEINDSQEAIWRKTLQVFDESHQQYRNVSLFPVTGSGWPRYWTSGENANVDNRRRRNHPRCCRYEPQHSSEDVRDTPAS